MAKKNHNLADLPSVFYADKDFDTDLLEKIFKAAPNTALYYKKALSFVTQTEASTSHANQKRVAKIALALEDNQFRINWYEQSARGRGKKRLMSLYELVHFWLCESHPDIKKIEKNNKQQVFLKIADRTFINPPQLLELLQQLFEMTTDPRHVALYLWSFSEVALCKNEHNAQFTADDLQDLSKITPELQDFVSRVRALLTPHVRVNSRPEESSEETTATNSLKAVPADSSRNPAPTVETGLQSKTSLSLRRQLSDIQTTWISYSKRIENLVSLANSLKNDLASLSIISEVEKIVGELKDSLQVVRQSMNSYEKSFDGKILEIAHSVDAENWSINATLGAEKEEPKEWLGKQLVSLAEFDRFERLFNAYQEYESKLSEHGYSLKWEGAFDQLSGLIAWLETNIAEAEVQHRELTLASSTISNCLANSIIFTWDPLRDETFQLEKCRIFFSAVLEPPPHAYLLGFALRVLLDSGSEEYINTSGILNEWNNDLARTCKILSVLSRSQTEKLWEIRSDLRPALSLCLLNSWLESCDLEDPLAVNYWDWMPLRDPSSHSKLQTLHLENCVHQFLHELSILVVKGEIDNFDDFYVKLTEAEEIEHSNGPKFKEAVDVLMDQFNNTNSDHNHSYLAAYGWWLNKVLNTRESVISTARNPHNLLSTTPISESMLLEDGLLWRCIETADSQLHPNWGQYIADLCSLWSNHSATEAILEDWKKNEQLNHLRYFNSKLQEPGSSIDEYGLSEWIASHEQNLQLELTPRLKAIKSKFVAFHSETKLLLSEEYEEIESLISASKWHNLKARVNLLEEEVNKALEVYGANDRRNQICSDITVLGGEVSVDSIMSELEAQLEALLADSEERMRHIKPLQDLLELPNLPVELEESIINVLNITQKPEHIPSSERSEWLALVLTTLLERIVALLQNYLLLSTHAQDLLRSILQMVVRLLADPNWISDSNSEIEEILVQLSSRFEKSRNDQQSLEEIRDWMSNHKYLMSETNSDWDVFPSKDTQQNVQPVASPKRGQASLGKARLVIRNYLASMTVKPSTLEQDEIEKLIERELRKENWKKAAALCAQKVQLSSTEQFDEIFYLQAGLALSSTIHGTELTVVTEAFLQVFDRADSSILGTSVFRKKSKKDDPQLAKIAENWLQGNEGLDTNNWTHYEQTKIQLAATRCARLLGDNARDPAISLKSNFLDYLWTYASGETHGAQFRAQLLTICSQASVFGALVYLLMKDPVNMQKERAVLFSGLLERATDVPGSERLIAFLQSERTKQSSRPFTLFAEVLLETSKKRNEHPATIQILGIDKSTEKGIWTAVVEITPSALDPPQQIMLNVAEDSPVQFGSGDPLSHQLIGPFLDKMQLRIKLSLNHSIGGKLPVDVRCRVKSLQEITTEYIQTWRIDVTELKEDFVPPSKDFIQECFDGFPHVPMRGDNYIPRDESEKKIEQALFGSYEAGSLWLTSPRRSGKTTMLFRVLDEYSYVKGRDDIVLYLTLNSTYENQADFNAWIWKRVARARENKKLQEQVPNLGVIRASADIEDDVDMFVAEISEKLLEHSPSGARIYYVIDEVDRFAEMFLEGGAKRDLATSIMWSLRNLISNEKNIGILFAGSHAARRFFVTEPTSPFYNSIISLSLLPFDVDTPQNEKRTRDIVLPKRLAATFKVPQNTLKHLVRITAGIPYYMKLLSGATFACAQNENVYSADVNEGLERMLNKETGIVAIDSLENPGEDELRTIYAETKKEVALIKGVLLAVAQIRSPAGVHPVNVGEIWSEKSPLVVHAQLTREIIEPALRKAIDMGFLKASNRNEYQVEFTIPLLGESLRRRFNVMWAAIEFQLQALDPPQ